MAARPNRKFNLRLGDDPIHQRALASLRAAGKLKLIRHEESKAAPLPAKVDWRYMAKPIRDQGGNHVTFYFFVV
jgi:hypothetical protein